MMLGALLVFIVSLGFAIMGGMIAYEGWVEYAEHLDEVAEWEDAKKSTKVKNTTSEESTEDGESQDQKGEEVEQEEEKVEQEEAAFNFLGFFEDLLSIGSSEHAEVSQSQSSVSSSDMIVEVKGPRAFWELGLVLSFFAFL